MDAARFSGRILEVLNVNASLKKSMYAAAALAVVLAGSYAWANGERRWWHESIAVEAK